MDPQPAISVLLAALGASPQLLTMLSSLAPKDWKDPGPMVPSGVLEVILGFADGKPGRALLQLTTPIVTQAFRITKAKLNAR